MGSIDKACISGFLCRLCSEMHRIVIHIYGDQGQRLCLVEKINGYLPITISPTDPLPKTICTTCLRRVEQHYDLLMRLSRIREERFVSLNKNRQRIEELPLVSSAECSDDEVYHTDEDYRRRRQLLPNRSSMQQAPTSTSTSSTVEASSSSNVESSSSSSATVTDSNTANGEEIVASANVVALGDTEQNFAALDDAASTSSSHSAQSFNNVIVVDRFEIVSPVLND